MSVEKDTKFKKQNNISSNIIKHSIREHTNEHLITYVLKFPRSILAELNTHRMFSRNSASSRAIPFNRMYKSVNDNPFIPMLWQEPHSGMQGFKYKSDEESKALDRDWYNASRVFLSIAKEFHNNGKGCSKQVTNRLLEPFLYHKVIITTGLEGLNNFFNQRCPNYVINNNSFKSLNEFKEYCTINNIKLKNDYKYYNTSGAEIHIQCLAESMYDELNFNNLTSVDINQLSLTDNEDIYSYHLPFADDEETLSQVTDINKSISWLPNDSTILNTLIKISVARCARVSYNVFGSESKSSIADDLKLYDKLLNAGHMSPFEHCCKVMNDDEYNDYTITKPSNNNTTSISKGWCRNFKGFIQWREIVERDKQNDIKFINK